MRYLVYGAGAVGGYLGGSLALAGYPVAFFDRPEVAKSLRATGLTLEASGTSGGSRRWRVTGLTAQTPLTL
jgi:2-dehydropantoate 2-reductase